MTTQVLPDRDLAMIQTLADFRCELRRFLQFSEVAALEAGLQPQQHQLLLQIAGTPACAVTTIAYVAERLGLKHNSTVELADRSEREGLLFRAADEADKRRAVLRLTPKGRKLLVRLSDDHARELNEMAPRLIKTLGQIQRTFRSRVTEAG